MIGHLRGGPLDGTEVAICRPHDELQVWDATKTGTHGYRRRPVELHPASFLARHGGRLDQSGADLLFNRPGTLVPDRHWIYDHESLPPAGRLRSDMSVSSEMLRPGGHPMVWQVLARIAAATVATLEEVADAEEATFDRRDLEWSARPVLPGVHNVRCEVVAERPRSPRPMPDLPSTVAEMDEALADPDWFRAAAEEHGADVVIGRCIDLTATRVRAALAWDYRVNGLRSVIDVGEAHLTPRDRNLSCGACYIESIGVPPAQPHTCGRFVLPSMVVVPARRSWLQSPWLTHVAVPLAAAVTAWLLAALAYNLAT